MNQLAGYQVLANCYQSANTLILKAIRVQDQLPVMIKVPTRGDGSVQRSKRSQNEFLMGSRIKSPFVIRYLELVQVPLGLGIVTEDCQGKPLNELLSDKGMSLELFLSLAEGMAQGLADIHRHGVIHKDIKPANILVHSGNQIKYIDFGISSRHTQEAAGEPELGSRLEGTLAYISPEQTGRMNRPIDYRTDFYSLGATFYHMLSGQLPFENSDNLELVHSHLARRLRPLVELRPDVPEIVSLLIEKLMAKSMEERYQSCDGVVEDVRRCRSQWSLFGKISLFKLALGDVPERFRIPSRLYGRDSEISILHGALDRVSTGTREMILVTGPAGVGKSTLIHQLEKPHSANHGFFSRGKFNPFADESVYSGLSEAFGKLVGMLLGEEDPVIAVWSEKLKTALGSQASAVVEFIPELEWLIGKQILPERQPEKLHEAMGQFVACFASPSKPLVLFLDDIHLADAASLEMITAMLKNPAICGLLVIGAAREDQTSETLFDFWMEDMRGRGVAIPILTISPLNQDQLAQLIAETLGLREDRVAPLAKIFQMKTGGNPYFAFQLLKTFYRDGLIFIDRETGHWDWREDKILAAAIPDNLADLVVARLHKLPVEVQVLLQRAACIGNLFSPKLLAQISDLSYEEALEHLEVARDENLIGLPQKANYPLENHDVLREEPLLRFQHHRVWRSAYDMTLEHERPQIHLRIAQALMSWEGLSHEPENINTLVHHYNEARSQIHDPNELLVLARLNQKQAKKALHAVAYATALRFLAIGIDCLPDDAWTSQYRLCFDLHFLQAEVCYLSAKYEQAQSVSELLRRHALDRFDHVKAIELEVVYLITVARYGEAVSLGLAGLNQLEMRLPRLPSKLRLAGELVWVRLNSAGKSFAKLADAPALDSIQLQAQLNLLMRLNLASYLNGEVRLYALLAIRRVRLIMDHGASPEAANAYVTYGVLLSMLGDYDRALAFGKLALQLDERFQMLSLRCKVLVLYALTIHCWHYPWQTMIPYFREAIEVGIQTGDHLYSSLASLMNAQWDPSLPLQDAYEQSRRYLELSRNHGLALQSGLGELIQRYLLCLMGQTANRFNLDGGGFNEGEVLAKIKESGFMAGLALYDVIRLELSFLYGAYHHAETYLKNAAQSQRVLGGTPYVALWCLYQFLTLTALQNGARPGLRLRAKLGRLLHRMEKWAKRCAANFRHYALLMRAELDALLGNCDRAASGYAAALETAQHHKCLSFSGVAAETACRFFLRHGHPTIARTYLNAADQAYQTWGAHGKMAHLRETYPSLLAAAPFQAPFKKYTEEESPTLVQGEGHLVKVFHIAETLFSEMDYQRLCHKLVRSVLDATRAETAALIMQNGGEWLVEVCLHEDQRADVFRKPLAQCFAVCQRAVRETLALQGPLNLSDALVTSPYNQDPYVVQHAVRSLLCSPIRFKDQLRGVIYLETTQTAGVFSEDDLACLTILGGPAAISLENAMLFTQSQAAGQEVANLNLELSSLNEALEERVLERTAELQKVQSKLVERAHYEGMSEIATAVLHNVGSVLNSVLTSCQTIGDTLRGSRLPGLLRANEMLRQNFDHIGHFLAHTPKGQDLMRYYLELDKHYLREKNLIREDLTRLIDLVESIRSIIMAQQNYARSSFLPEPILVCSALDDALGLLSGDLVRSQVRVERDYREQPSLTLPKSKLINVAVSLIRNAIEAMEQLDFEFRRLRIATIIEVDRFVIRFSDTGKGIELHQLETIFWHGFTTKVQGKGFGLHAAANAMTEMGGSIRAESNGPGEGATFSLFFPKP